MSTPAQIAANKENAQHSTGPKTEAGKAASSINNFRHGLAGSFMIMDWENREDFDELFDSLRAEHKPTSPDRSAAGREHDPALLAPDTRSEAPARLFPHGVRRSASTRQSWPSTCATKLPMNEPSIKLSTTC